MTLKMDKGNSTCLKIKKDLKIEVRQMDGRNLPRPTNKKRRKKKLYLRKYYKKENEERAKIVISKVSLEQSHRFRAVSISHLRTQEQSTPTHLSQKLHTHTHTQTHSQSPLPHSAREHVSFYLYSHFCFFFF